MLNLLPIETKKEYLKLYRLRIATSSIWFVLIAFIIVFGFLFSIYIIISSEQSILKKDLKRAKSQQEFQIEETLRQDITEINKKLIVFSESKKLLFSQDIMTPLLSEVFSDIKITKILFFNELEKTPRMEIIGIATNRHNLQIFVDNLEKNPAFDIVELPISEFVKNKDIDFHINIFLK